MKKYYVYKLRRRDRRAFYVGKGTGDRMYAHEKETIRKLEFNLTHKNKMRLTRKEQEIASILLSGHEIIYDIVFETDDEQEAYREEKKHIKAEPFLYNIVGRVKFKYPPKVYQFPT